MIKRTEYNRELLAAADPHRARRVFSGASMQISPLPWWKVWWVKRRGQRIEAHDSGWTTVSYLHKGVLYVTESYFEPKGGYVEFVRYGKEPKK